MSLINITGLTFSHEGSYDNIFEGVSFQIDTDWRLGLTGRNGRGKTTFLNLLLGKYEYRGSISATAQFRYFPFEIYDKSVLTIEAIAGVCPPFEDWELIRELSLLDCDAQVLYRPFDSLSRGEQTKVLLAGLFLDDRGYLLIDEPTNHLDYTGRRKVAGYLKTKKSFILVSHDRGFLDECVNHILSINMTNIEIEKGNFSSWWENKTRRDNFELSENEKLKKEITGLKAAARRSAEWANKTEGAKYGVRNSGLRPDRGYIGHKSAKMMKSAKNLEQRRDNAAAEKAGLLKNLESAESLKLHPLPYNKSRLAELRDVSVVYDGRAVFEGLSFKINQGDRICLRGKNGSGKSSVIKLLLGEEITHTGTVHLGSGLIISYVPQDACFLEGDLSDFARESEIDESLFKSILRKLDFSGVQFDKDMADFSDGQKKKVLIAKSLSCKAHLYIWDEPLNYIDVLSRMQIEELLLQYKPTMVFVEHDRIFAEGAATKFIEL